MNDRELMELAAKAGGIGGGWGRVETVVGETIDMTDIWFLDDPMKCPIWDPLNDDGDVLRLARSLLMRIDFDRREVWYPVGDGRWQTIGWHLEAYKGAVVRAAAEIWKTMLINETTQEQPK